MNNQDIHVPNEELQSALRLIQRLSHSKIITLMFKKDHLVILGLGETSSCSYKINLEKSVDKDQRNSITVELSLFLSLIDKRKNLKFKIEGGTLLISDKNYEAKLVGSEPQDLIVIPDEVKSGATTKIKSKLVTKLLQLLPAIELRPLLSTYSDVPLGIRVRKDKTFVACFDFIQSASSTIDYESKSEFDILVPSASLFNQLNKEFGSQSYDLSVTESVLYAWTDQIEVALSLPQPDGDQISLDDAQGLVEQLDSLEYKSMLFSTEKIQEFLQSSRSAYDKDSTFEVKASGDKAVLELKAALANMKMTLELKKSIKKPIEFKCDLMFFSSIINRCKGNTVRLKVNESLLRITQEDPKAGNIDYLMTLV